jgi:O-antigen biosynthesis protein
MKKLLIIGYVWPEPNSSAAGSRMLQLIALFQQHSWHIIFASPAAAGAHKVDLTAQGIDEVIIELNSSSFDDFVTELKPDMVLFDRFMMEEQFGWRVEKHCSSALRLLDTEDLHSLRQARHQALKKNREIETSDLNCELAMREVASILRCDLTLIVSSYEADLLTEHFRVDASLLHCVPFMLERLEQSNSNWPSFEQRQHFISIGNFRHAPNWDAVQQLKTVIWPLIRKQLPKVELHIYGAYPPPKSTQLHNPKQGFEIKGWAEDAPQVMSNARVCLAPLRFGAGIKGKLTEAMQNGTASITTSIGAEAMHGNMPWNGVITDDPEAFANAAVTLYQNESLWQQSQQQGINIINQFYDKTLLGSQLIARIEELTSALDTHRLNNFTGAMLRHHSMKSTQYMAQWIEAKNAPSSNQVK